MTLWLLDGKTIMSYLLFFPLACVFILFGTPVHAESDEVPLDIYLFIDVSETMSLQSGSPLRLSLQHLFYPCLHINDGITVVFFENTYDLFKKRTIIESQEQKNDILDEIQQMLDNPNNIHNLTRYKDTKSWTKFDNIELGEIFNKILEEMDLKSQQQFINRRQLLIFLTDGEESFRDGISPSNQIDNLGVFPDLSQVKWPNGEVRAVKFIFFILSHSNQGQQDSEKIKAAWKRCFDRKGLSADSQCVDITSCFTEKDYGKPITDAIGSLRTLPRITCRKEEDVIYTPNTNTISPLALSYISTFDKEKKITLLLKPIVTSDGNKAGSLRFKGWGYELATLLAGTDIAGHGQLLSISQVLQMEEMKPLYVDTSGLKFHVSLNAEEEEVKAALDPKEIEVPLQSRKVKFTIDFKQYEPLVAKQPSQPMKLCFQLSQDSPIEQILNRYYKNLESIPPVTVESSTIAPVPAMGNLFQDIILVPIKIEPDPQNQNEERLFGGIISYKKSAGENASINKPKWQCLWSFGARQIKEMKFVFLVEEGYNSIGKFIMKAFTGYWFWKRINLFWFIVGIYILLWVLGKRIEEARVWILTRHIKGASSGKNFQKIALPAFDFFLWMLKRHALVLGVLGLLLFWGGLFKYLSVVSWVSFTKGYWYFPRYWDEWGITVVGIVLLISLLRKIQSNKLQNLMRNPGTILTLIVFFRGIFVEQFLESIFGIVISWVLSWLISR